MMDELAKAVQKKYIDDIVSKYPLHRFAILLILLLSFHIQYDLNNYRIVQGISEIKVNFIFDFSKGLLAQITINQLFWGVVLTYLIKYLYNLFSMSIFNFLSGKIDFSKYTEKIIMDVTSRKSQDNLVNYYVSLDVSKELEKARSQLKSSHATSEILMSLIVSITLGGIHLVTIDYLIISVLLILIVAIQWVNFKFYVSNFIPYYLTEKALLGSKAKFGDQFHI